ncbi:MAG: hypothetical protein KatS3mg124_1447 [Porticoccaceae bacterium]|nr:MAG: hypothetical protein KatS3mg124_1447 [Porticoccaceae bacterium]
MKARAISRLSARASSREAPGVAAAQKLVEIGHPDVALEGVEGGAHPRRERPLAVVVPPPIVAAALVGEPLAAGRLVLAHAQFQGEERPFRNASGAHVDEPAGEMGRQVHRVTLLHRQALDDVGGEDVERQDVAGQIRGGHHGAVEQRGGVAFAQAAHVDELVLHQGNPRHPPQRGGHGGIADAADPLGVHQIGDRLVIQPLEEDVLYAALQARGDDHLLQLRRFEGGRRDLLGRRGQHLPQGEGRHRHGQQLALALHDLPPSLIRRGTQTPPRAGGVPGGVRLCWFVTVWSATGGRPSSGWRGRRSTPGSSPAAG